MAPVSAALSSLSVCTLWRLVPFPIIVIVFLKLSRVLGAGTTAVLKRLDYKTQDLFLEVALALVEKPLAVMHEIAPFKKLADSKPKGLRATWLDSCSIIYEIHLPGCPFRLSKSRTSSPYCIDNHFSLVFSFFWSRH